MRTEVIRSAANHGRTKEYVAGRIRVGVVGLNFGRHIVQDLLQEPHKEFIELAAICDLDATKAAEIARRSGARVVNDLDELLVDPTIDAIGLFTGPIGRAELIRKIIRAGKHVMTTKPFELDPDAAADVLEEARKLGRIVHLNSPAPHLPGDLQRVLHWQDKYSLGRPVACRREVWASYREAADGSWYDDPVRCPVAPIFRLGIYLINDMVRLFGPAESVQVAHSRLFTGRPTPDNALMTIQFRNGVLGSIFASFCVDDGQYYSNTMTLNYERGTIFRNAGPFAYGQANGHAKMAVVAKTGVKETEIEQVDEHEVSGSYQWETFQRAVHGNASAEETLSPDVIVNGIRVIAAMARAEKSGATERV